MGVAVGLLPNLEKNLLVSFWAKENEQKPFVDQEKKKDGSSELL